MKGFLSRIIERQLRHLTLSTTLGIAIITTSAVAAGRGHEPKFDEVAVAVAKAQHMVSAGVCGSPGDKVNDACAKLMKKAQDLLSKAGDAISAAAVAADGGGVILRR